MSLEEIMAGHAATAAQTMPKPLGSDQLELTMQEYAADQRRRMQGALATSVKTNPDAYAAQKQLAKYVGVPPIVAQTLPDEIKSKAAVQRVQADTVDAPLLARSYTDADFAKLAHDDSGVLSAIEAGVRWLVSAPSRDGKASTLAGDVAASYHGMTQGAAGAFQGLTETASYPLDVLENFPRIGGNPLRRLSEGFGLIARQAAADQKAAAGESKTWMGGAISSGVQSLGQNLAMIPLALLPGGQAAALTGMAATAGGQSYQEDRAKGVGHFTALGHGLSDAVIEAATEAVPMGRLIKDVKAGGPLWKAITANAAREVPGEQVATALQDLNDWAVNNEGKTFGDYLAARPEAAAQTLIATLVGVGGNVAVSHGIQGAVDRATGAQRQAQQAELHAQALGQLATLAEASKLRERDPEQFQTFAQSLADQNVPSLYVDPRALQAAGVDMQALAQALPSVAPQLEQAIATGGDLVIPTGEFVTHAPGQVFQQALVEHARTAEDAMSPAEAKTYMAEHGDKLQAEIARVIEQKAGDETWQAGRDQVRAEFQRQLDEVRRFTPDVNKTYATVLGDFYAVTAAKAGMSPQELAQRYPLRIASKLGEGENVMDQPQLPVDSEGFVKWFDKSHVVDEDGRPAVVYHGTPAGGFDTFDPSKAGTRGTFESARAGMFFTSNPDYANAMSRSPNEAAPTVYPVFLSVQNPLRVHSTELTDEAEIDAMLAQAKEGGHDGIMDEYGNVVVFRPEQIKSATGNRGTFDPNDPSILNQFAGPRAATADTHALASAQQRIAAGEDAEAVRQSTGWSTGADGKWRFEISDADARLKPALESLKTGGHAAKQIESITYQRNADGTFNVTLNPPNPQTVGDFVELRGVSRGVLDAVLPPATRDAVLRGDGNEGFMGNLDPAFDVAARFEFGGFDALPLSEAIDHPALFAAYPKLADVMVQVDPKLGNGGAFVMVDHADGKMTKVIRIGRAQQLSTLLHEIQHGIQAIEGFASGGSVAGMADILPTAQDINDARVIRARVDRGDTFSEAAKWMRDKMGRTPSTQAMNLATGKRDALRNMPSGPADGYKRLAGEVEARNTQARAAMTDAQRAATPPEQTADVNRADVIVTFNGKEMASAPDPANAAPAAPARGQIAFGRDITQSTSTLTLLKDADLSTFIHEAGHFFLEVQADLAGRIEARIADGEVVSDGERGIVADMNRLLEWFGVKGTDQASGVTGGSLDQPAYHGTPYRGIDKFTTDKIGTGEGNQAYGWGLYFASKREIAEWYREVLTRRLLGDEVSAQRKRELEDMAGDALTDNEAAALERLLDENPDADFFDMLDRAVNEAKKAQGQLYEVEIPEDSEMLLWDKPLSEQPEKVREALLPILQAEVDRRNAQREALNAASPGRLTHPVLGKIASKVATVEDLRGQTAYEELSKHTGSDKAASEALMAAGIKGIKYLDGTSRNAGDGSHNYVIFSGDDVAIKNTFYQGGQEGEQPGPSPQGRTALETWSLMSLEEKRQHHETFARGFERYAFEGKAPSLALQPLLQRFRAWMVNIYKSLKALNVELTPEVRGVMDRMLATTQQIKEAEAARNMGALFQTPEQAGMTPEQWAAYHHLAVDATQQAIENLQARGLRDMTWQRNATSRELKKLQDRAKGLRREIEREVRAEVMSQPVYRAWAFLTGKGEPDQQAQAAPRVKATGELDNSRDNLFVAIAKLGGLNRAEVESQWGIRPKDERLEIGVFGKPVVRREGGLSLDAMAERLVEEGYLLPDEHGKADLRDLEEAFDSQRRGQDQFSIWHDYAERAAAANGEQSTDALPEHATHGKLDTETLREMYGTQPDALWRKLSTLRMTSDKVGIHPDVVAETFGFSGGDEMVRALAAADHPMQVIEGLADQRMLERYGDLATPEGLQRAADQAVHTEYRARAIATELSALEAAGKVRQKVPGQRNTADMLVKAAKEYAAAVIGASKVRDIKPSRYAAAEARAGAAAEKHFKAGDTQGAAAEKRNQVIQHEAARAAYAAQDEVEKATAYLRKFDRRPKGLDTAYADQIDSLLERFDLKPASLKDIDRRASLAEWVASQQEQGMEPDIPPELLREASRKSWRDMTLDELRGLRDTVRQIDVLGRLKGKLLTAQAQREFEAVRDELADSITQHAGDRKADTRTPATVLGRKLAAVKAFGAAHIKAATWARILDGGKDGGPVWEYLIRGANRAGDFETTRRAQATEALTQILAPVLKQKMGGKGVFFKSINRTMNREQVFSLALNTGNEGNLQRLLDGEGWTQQQIQPVLATLTAAEWRAVQGVWDHFESYRPEIGAKERRIYGKEPNWVEPAPFNIQSADGVAVVMRGGYYPIKYDPLANNRAEQHSDAESAKRELQGAYTSATTRRGFTKSRTAEVSGRPILYSLAGIYSGVNDVIHDLAWHEWLIDTNKLLRSEKVDGAIRQHYGPQVVKQFKTWVKDTAAGEGGLQAELDSTLGRLRHGVSIAGLGFNVMSAVMQPLGLTQSIVRVGAGWIGKGVAQYVANPRAATRRVNDASEFMAGRARTRFRELAELRNQVEGQSKARDAISTWAYFLMMRCQQMVDVPTWLGAYEKAISEGNTEERAVALADQAVIDAQGGGQTKDLSAIERGGPAQKLFMVFYGFMNTALNVGTAQTMTAAKTPKARARLAADYLLLYSVPAVLGAVLKDALTPGDSGDWDDPEKLLKKLLGEQLAFLMGLMVVVREFAEAGKTALSLSEHPRDYSGPAGVRLISDTSTMAKQAAQGEFDDQFRKAAVNLMGDLFALPAAQVNRTITGAQALADGKTSNPAALVFGFQAPH